MSVSVQDVLHVARLARLRIDDSELSMLTAQLNNILEHVAQLATLKEPDAADAADAEVVAEWPAPLRSDAPAVDQLAFPALDLSNQARAGFFTVPRLAAMDGEAG